jgi:uncharacterized caspase-like protein
MRRSIGLRYLWLFSLVIAACTGAQVKLLPGARQVVVEAPTVHVGDEWRYTGGAFVRVLGFEGAHTILVSNIEPSCQDCRYFSDKKGNVVQVRDVQGANGSPRFYGSVGIPLDFPLHVGKEWTYDLSRHTNRFRVKTYEEVSVKAGTFKAFRIAWHQSSDRWSGDVDLWWSPDVKGIVKRMVKSYVRSEWVRELELESYTLNSTGVARQHTGQSGTPRPEPLPVSVSPTPVPVAPPITVPSPSPHTALKPPATQRGNDLVQQPSRHASPPTPLAPRTNAYALVIGIDYAGRNDVSPLRYAAADAQKFYDLLTDPAVGGIPKEQVTLILNQQATRTEIVVALEKMLRHAADPAAHIYLYYSGHGAPLLGQGGSLEDGYLVPYDVRLDSPKTLEYTALKFSDVRREVEQTASQHVLVALDACFSGGGKSVVPRGGPKPLVGILPPSRLTVRGRGKVLLTSSAMHQVSWESDKLAGGLFTALLLKGLQGEADTNRNGWVEVHEVFDYLKREVPRAAAAEQKRGQEPELLGQGNFGITRNHQLLALTERHVAIALIKQAYDDGLITPAQLDRAIQELDLTPDRRSKPLTDFLSGALPARAFGQVY